MPGCSEEHVTAVVQQTMAEAADPDRGLSYDDFKHILDKSPLTLEVELPSDV